MIANPPVAVDQIGIIIKAHPAVMARRRREAVKLPILDVELWSEPEGMDEESPLKPVVTEIGTGVRARPKDMARPVMDHDIRSAMANAGACARAVLSRSGA
jgi:hypothetical protein